MSTGDDSAQLTRIFPPGGAAALSNAAQSYGLIDFTALAPVDRPYVAVNMVATLDGQGRIGEDTGQLGDSADAALFAALRERVDCVMAGARTIEIEGYNAPARSEAVRARRVAAGLAPRPLVATVTRSGHLATDAPLYADPGISLRIFSGQQLDTSGIAADVEVVDTVEPAEVLRELRQRDGVRSVLLEGGPHLNTPFFAAGLVDELFLTLAPVLTGASEAFPIIAGALPEAQSAKLVSVYEARDQLFMRYRLEH